MKQRQLYEWTGRIDADATRMHEAVTVLNETGWNAYEPNGQTFAFVGFASEEGVRRNAGRLGAKQAPRTIRQAIASLPYRFNRALYDLGDVVCDDYDLEGAQAKLGDTIAEALAKQSTPIIFGGGHETAYAHYLGVRKALGPEAVLGVFNIDAHFDIRNQAKPSSGTMFRQMIESDDNVRYFVAGIQPLGNTTALYEQANELGVTYVEAETLDVSFDATLEQIDDWLDGCDAVMMTLCTDVIRQAEAPGVSAPAPFGLSASRVRSLMRHMARHPKLTSFDISEVNPAFDRDGQTARLAAHLAVDTMASIERGDRV